MVYLKFPQFVGSLELIVLLWYSLSSFPHFLYSTSLIINPISGTALKQRHHNKIRYPPCWDMDKRTYF